MGQLKGTQYVDPVPTIQLQDETKRRQVRRGAGIMQCKQKLMTSALQAYAKCLANICKKCELPCRFSQKFRS
jgi:hypothetical protein